MTHQNLKKNCNKIPKNKGDKANRKLGTQAIPRGEAQPN